MASRVTTKDAGQADPLIADLQAAAIANVGAWTCHQFADAPTAEYVRSKIDRTRFEVRAFAANYPSTVAIRTKK